MQRLAASLLIVLTALMAFLPQAMCPCSTRLTAAGDAPASAVRSAGRACCPLCQRSADRPAPSSGKTPRAPGVPQTPGDPCPCCRMNGQGKWLVTAGASVKPLAPDALEFVVLAPSLPPAGSVGAVVVARTVTLPSLDPPPLDLRAGIVLLI